VPTSMLHPIIYRTVEVAALLRRIWEALGSNLGLEIVHPGSDKLFVAFLSHFRLISRYELKLRHDLFPLHLFNSFFTNCAVIHRHII
jgi:hypothetical protein